MWKEKSERNETEPVVQSGPLVIICREYQFVDICITCRDLIMLEFIDKSFGLPRIHEIELKKISQKRNSFKFQLWLVTNVFF